MKSNANLKTRRLLVALGGAAAVLASFASLDVAAQASITSTRHNLGTSNTTGSSSFSGTGEVCVFCHTPHGSNTTMSAPLWNKTSPTTTYSMYSTGQSASLDGTEAAVGGVSLACLSCHDGSLAIATMINMPGSGGYNPAGAVMAGTWTNPSLTDGVDTATGQMRATSIQNIGANLVNDHPISIQYCGGGLTGAGTTVNGACVDSDFQLPKTRVANGNQVFWVDTTGGTADVREKTDIALYNRSGVVGPMVECASCHDPHTAVNPTFLRVSNTTVGSGLCLSCHTK